MKKWIALLLSVGMLLCLGGCGVESGELPAVVPIGDDTPGQSMDGGDSWSIYWYLCGSDLETNFGCATADLGEMEKVTLPKNVNIIIQTGGARHWQNEAISADKIQRWLYNSEGLKMLEELPAANMGKTETLSDVLSYGHENYPADREGVIFWNHGGGTTGGVAYDEVYRYDSLSLKEIGQAFEGIWGEEKLELVGFDACLMATIDVAAALEPYANYMVASQELEPGIGWEYSGWVSALAKDPKMDGAELGIAICNSYLAGCEDADCDEQVTQSVVDLTKVQPLLDAYEAFGQEALVELSEDPDFFARLGREARSSENYGGNSAQSGYGNMVDLGHFARKTAWLLPSAQGVTDALEDCVVYTVAGAYRPEASGLSCYYSFSGNLIDFYGYLRQGTGKSLKYVYAYGLAMEYLSAASGFLEDLGIIDLPEKETVYTMGWEDAPIYVDDEGCAVLELGEEASAVLTAVDFELYRVEEDRIIMLGVDDDMQYDWENGIFKDIFWATWGALDGHLVYMELMQSAENYNTYAVPVALNGEEYNLIVVYDFVAEAWEILGAAQSVDDAGMGGKDLRPLRPGDEITTVYYVQTGDTWQWQEQDTFTVTEQTRFETVDLDDGNYALVFQMYDGSGNVAYSQPAYYEVTDSDIITSTEFPY